MNFLDVQIATESHLIPSEEQLQRWVDAALPASDQDSEIVIRIIDEQESAELNHRYRHKTGPTNILSFPAELPDEVDLNLLGDLLVCAPVLEQEAKEQQKKLFDHWAHIIIHGVLHLTGHDHISDHEAEIMENLEIDILKHLNIANPYIEAIKS